MMMAVNLDEAALYRMQLQLIRKHFPGLRPRPVKIDNDMAPFAEASEPAMLFNLKIHRSKREVTQTLIHELIHYELADKGKNYSGHGRAFLKRAKALGLLEDSELFQCSQLEEQEGIPHSVEFVSMPLADAATEIDRYLDDLQAFVIRRVPISIRIPLYEKVKSIKVLWTCYHNAVDNGKDHILSEHWKRRRGPIGKSRDALISEAKVINQEMETVRKKIISGDQTARKELKRLMRRLAPISEKLQRDYDIDDY
jgi:hypothetical protein